MASPVLLRFLPPEVGLLVLRPVSGYYLADQPQARVGQMRVGAVPEPERRPAETVSAGEGPPARPRA